MKAYFLSDMKAYIMFEDPNTTVAELGSIAAERWMDLTKEQKKVYEDLADADRINLEGEFSKVEDGKEIIEVLEEEKRRLELQDISYAPKKSRGSYGKFKIRYHVLLMLLCVETFLITSCDDDIMTDFFTFDMQPQILLEDPYTKFTEVGSIMEMRWGALTKEQKKVYEDLADGDKIRFEREQEAFLTEVIMKSKKERRNLEVQSLAAHTAAQQNAKQNAMAMPTTMENVQSPSIHYTSFGSHVSNTPFYDSNQPYHFS